MGPRQGQTGRPQVFDALRLPLVQPPSSSFRVPSRVALYLFADGSWGIENFNDKSVAAELAGKRRQVAARDRIMQWKSAPQAR